MRDEVRLDIFSLISEISKVDALLMESCRFKDFFSRIESKNISLDEEGGLLLKIPWQDKSTFYELQRISSKEWDRR